MEKDRELVIFSLTFGLISISCFFLAFIIPYSEVTQISEDMYVESTSILPFFMLIFCVISAVIAIIFGVKAYWEKSKEKLGVKTKRTFQVITVGLVTGFLLVVVGIFLSILGIGRMGGYGGELFIGLILLPTGIIMIICFAILFALKANNIKRNIAVILSFVLALIVISSIFMFSYFVIFDYRWIPPEHTPTIFCSIDSHNETENRINWIVTDIDYNSEIFEYELEFRLLNSSYSYDPESLNVIFQDNDNSISVTGDIFEAYAPKDGNYTFHIIYEPMGSLAFSDIDKY